jgi:hypothetical protein
MKNIDITVGELFNFLGYTDHNFKIEKSWKNNHNIKIKNDKGKYVDILEFVLRKEDSYQFFLKNGLELISSKDHKILTKQGLKKLSDIKYVNNILLTNKKKSKLLAYVLHKKNDILYDFCLKYPHLYSTTNGLIHHNSLSIYLIIRFLITMNKKAVIVVPNTLLCEQMYNDFNEYSDGFMKDKVSILYSGKTIDPNCPILLSTYQSLIKKDSDFFKQYSGLIVDECVSEDTNIMVEKDKTEEIKNLKKKNYILTVKDSDYKLLISKEKQRIKENDKKSGDYITEPKNCIIFKTTRKRNKEQKYRLTFENGKKLIITGNHKVYTQRGKVRVDQLEINDKILGL